MLRKIKWSVNNYNSKISSELTDNKQLTDVAADDI